MDWHWTRSSIRSSIPSGKKTKQSSSARRITSRSGWSDRNLETERWSSEQIWVEHSQHWSDASSGRARWQEAEATRKDFNILLTRQDKKSFIFELFKVIQDAIPLILHFRTMCQFRTIFFEYTYHIGCAVSLHSITNSGLIAGGQNSSRERQTVFFTAVNPMDKEHRDPHELDLTKPRLASYKQQWRRHQDTVYWVDIQLVQRKGLKFYQTRCNANRPLRYTPSLLYLERCCDGIWRNPLRESICVTSTTSDDFLQR